MEPASKDFVFVLIFIISYFQWSLYSSLPTHLTKL